MKHNVVKILFGRRDSTIKEWHKMMVKSGSNISKTIEYAIIYHMVTGDYLHLGNIPEIKEDDAGASSINAYISPNSRANAWFSECISNGEKKSTALKRILRRGITSDPDKPPSVVDLDSLYDVVMGVIKNTRNLSNISGDAIATGNTGFPMAAGQQGSRAAGQQQAHDTGSKEQINGRLPETKDNDNDDFMQRMIPTGFGLGE